MFIKMNLFRLRITQRSELELGHRENQLESSSALPLLRKGAQQLLTLQKVSLPKYRQKAFKSLIKIWRVVRFSKNKNQIDENE